MSQLTREEQFLLIAQEAAGHATCLKAKCGTAIGIEDELISTGFNQPALGDESNRKCRYRFPHTTGLKPKSDRTCCVHAEENAIIAAIKTGRNLTGSTMYFMRIDEHGKQTIAGNPYCIGCARFALNNGISFWVLLQESGPKVYAAKEYYELSIAFHNPIKG